MTVTLYQGGENVPMIVSGVDVRRLGEREDALVHTTDLFATIANITGVSVSEIQNSKSFYPQLTSATNDGRSFVYTEIVDGYTIRNATYKLIKYDNGDEELYNLVQDPYENRNLIGTTLSAEATNEKANLISEAIAIRN
ncbi:hypothetical protein N9484_07450 [Polaribacter sp.]|nr:hypothetical protein [Polaribacter sp.]MDB4181516.1 hypothetical protein [Polaribacter sp.]